MRSLRFMGPVERPDSLRVARALETSATVTEFLSGLGYAARHQHYLQVSSRGRRLAPHDALPDDGEIVIALPMGGG
ncbi:hypothetical protein JXA88_17560 [Candidatus Fermentibacteria bacterium]|nr:hypothetical protein [Candidatus Fermentibacteria bacterium]